MLLHVRVNVVCFLHLKVTVVYVDSRRFLCNYIRTERKECFQNKGPEILMIENIVSIFC